MRRRVTWDDGAREWRIETSAGPLTASVLVLPTGPLSAPAIPDLPGLDRFKGGMMGLVVAAALAGVAMTQATAVLGDGSGRREGPDPMLDARLQAVLAEHGFTGGIEPTGRPRAWAAQPAFFHNGAFTQLEDAIRHHLDVVASTATYDPELAGLDQDLRHRRGPTVPMLARLDPVLATPISLSNEEFAELVDFVRHGLLDPRAVPESLCRMLPLAVPSRMDVGIFQDCSIF